MVGVADHPDEEGPHLIVVADFVEFFTFQLHEFAVYLDVWMLYYGLTNVYRVMLHHVEYISWFGDGNLASSVTYNWSGVLGFARRLANLCGKVLNPAELGWEKGENILEVLLC